MTSRLIQAGLAAAALAATSLAAHAADLRAPQPTYRPMPPVAGPCMTCNTWSGMYIGANFGWGFGNANYAFATGGSGGGGANLFSSNASGSSFSHKPSGYAFGGHIGFNQQSGNMVAGLEAMLDWTGIKRTTTNPFAITPGTATYETRVRWLGSVTPRLGYAMGSFLFYGKGGLALASLESNLRSTALGGRRFSETSGHLGWTIGTGLEWAVMSNWIVGVGYDYYSFGKRKYGGKVSPNTTFPLQYTVQPSFHTLMARASYKFGN